MSQSLHVAFLGCGFITRIHSRHLRALRPEIVCSYASRDRRKAEACCRRFPGGRAYGSYAEAIDDPAVHAVVVAVPPSLHLDLVLAAIKAGKHVLVEKPAFPDMSGYDAALAARNAAGVTVMVGENDHYKPLAVRLRRLIADGAIGDMVFANLTTVALKFKDAGDWRNDETMAGGDAFFEEGIHWLHIAGSLGPKIASVVGFRPQPVASGGDRRAKSMMVAFRYDNDAAGALFYSREVPSLFKGLRLSSIAGRRGIITFESNGLFVLVRGPRMLPRVYMPGYGDIRGYKAMYRDFAASIAARRQPEMSLERAIEDQRLMEQIYSSLPPKTP